MSQPLTKTQRRLLRSVRTGNSANIARADANMMLGLGWVDLERDVNPNAAVLTVRATLKGAYVAAELEANSALLEDAAAFLKRVRGDDQPEAEALAERIDEHLDN